MTQNGTAPPHLEAIGHICEAIAAHERFLICGHTRPDGDCLGSQLALQLALKAMGKRAFCFVNGPVLGNYSFLPGFHDLRRNLTLGEHEEATFLLDCASPARVADGFQPQGLTVCIDHHETNDWRADINYIDKAASSTGELIFEVFEKGRTPITPEIATCLYTAILTDTGSFRYANTTPRSLAVGARLLECGAAPASISSFCYEMREPRSVMLAGAVLSRLRFECGGALVWGEITRDMYDAAGGEENEPERLVSDMRGIKGVKVSALFKQTPKGCRASLRSKGGARVDKIAEQFGGGGHRKAAGADLEGDYGRLRDAILDALRTAAPKWERGD